MDIYTWMKQKYDIDTKDKTLLRDAFTHSSYVNEAKEETNHYERLEFLGDAIVDMWVSTHLYLHEPKITEGHMTTIRAQLVCEKSLATFLKDLGLQKFIRLGVGEQKNGGRDRESMLADVFEAMIAAIYLDQGYEVVQKVLSDAINVVDYVADHPEASKIVDYKTKLQEYVQADSRKVLTYNLIEEKGTANAPMFKIGVYLDGLLLGVGIEHSKKKAEQLAAKEALKKMAV